MKMRSFEHRADMAKWAPFDPLLRLLKPDVRPKWNITRRSTLPITLRMEDGARMLKGYHSLTPWALYRRNFTGWYSVVKPRGKA